MDDTIHRARKQRADRAQAARFIVVGALGTGVHYAVLLVLVEALRVAAVPATCVAFAFAGAFNYSLHRAWTYRCPVAHRRALAPFAAVAIIGFGLNATVMALGLSADMHYLVAQTVAVGVVIAWNYTFTTLIFSQPGTAALSTSKGSHHGPA